MLIKTIRVLLFVLLLLPAKSLAALISWDNPFNCASIIPTAYIHVLLVNWGLLLSSKTAFLYCAPELAVSINL